MKMSQDILLAWLARQAPWPDWLVTATVSPLPDYEPDDDMAAELAWQVSARVRAGQPVPEALQKWFNRYTVSGGHVPKRRPNRVEYDRALVAAIQALCDDVTLAEAIRLVSSASGRTFNAVETNVHRGAYKKKPL